MKPEDTTQPYTPPTGLYTIDGLTFPVSVIGAKNSYGRIDYLITPVDGSGEKWVNSHKVTDTK